MLAAQLGDLQLEPFDLQLQGIAGGVRLRGFKPGDFQRSASDLQITRPGFGRQTRSALGADHRVSVSQTGGERIRVICHTSSVPRTRCVARLCCSSGGGRTPGLLGITPVDALEQIAQLRGGNRHRAVSRRGPQKTTPIDPLVPHIGMQPRPSQISS